MPFGPRLDTNDWTLRLDTKVGMPFFWDPGWTLKLECLLGPGLDTKVGHKSTNNLYVFKLLAFGPHYYYYYYLLLTTRLTSSRRRCLCGLVSIGLRWALRCRSLDCRRNAFQRKHAETYKVCFTAWISMASIVSNSRMCCMRQTAKGLKRRLIFGRPCVVLFRLQK